MVCGYCRVCLVAGHEIVIESKWPSWVSLAHPNLEVFRLEFMKNVPWKKLGFSSHPSGTRASSCWLILEVASCKTHLFVYRNFAGFLFTGRSSDSDREQILFLFLALPWKSSDYHGGPLPRTVSFKAELPWKYLDVLCNEKQPATRSNLFCLRVYLLLAKTCCKMLSSCIAVTLIELQQSLSTCVPPWAFQIIEQETCLALGYLQYVLTQDILSWSQAHLASIWSRTECFVHCLISFNVEWPLQSVGNQDFLENIWFCFAAKIRSQ